MNYCFGIDIGGTSVKLGMFNSDGELIDKTEIPTRTENGGDKIFTDIAAALDGFVKKHETDKTDIIGVGMGVPAPVSENGFVTKSANLGIKNINVCDRLASLTGFKVKAANDANIAALGEMWKGGGKGAENMVMITLGTGVGGGIIINGKIFSGTNGATGEIGHLCVNRSETEKCGCGRCGCLEQYSSATGIVRMAKKAMSLSDTQTSLKKDGLTAKDVFDAVKSNDKLALEIADKFGEYLAFALSQTAVLVDPELFLIGGGVSKAGTVVLDCISKHYRQNAFYANQDVKFSLAVLDNDAGIYGGARLILGNG